VADVIKKWLGRRVRDDLLRGIEEIADEIGLTPRQTHYALTKGRIPAARDGNSWVASKETLRDHYKKLTAKSAA
jgi:hypothetical protein